MATVQPDQIPELVGCSVVVWFLGWAFMKVFRRDER